MKITTNTCLITGLPGSGKTLLAVEILLFNSKQDAPRPVYTNIKGLCPSLGAMPLPDDLDQIYVDTTHGHNSHPEGSIFVIDEAQSLGYAPLANGAKRPQRIKVLETRRHNGYDFIILTQHPKLIDKNVRVLLADHYHALRPFGAKFRVIKHWQTVNENPEPLQNDASASITRKPFNKELFSLYKSATVHTQKFNFPLKPFLVILVAIILVIVAFVTFKKTFNTDQYERPSVESTSGEPSTIYTATYSGFSMLNRRGMVVLDVFFNIDDVTFNLNNFDYFVEENIVTVLTESGNVFTIFEIEDYRPLEYL